MHWKCQQKTLLFTCFLGVLFFPCGEVSAQADEAIKHLSSGPLDRFRACAESVFKKHVIIHWLVGHDFENVSCPLGENQFREELKSRGYTVLAHDDWVFLVPSDILFQKIRPIGSNRSEFERPWKDVRVEVSIENAPEGSGTMLSRGQLDELKEGLLQRARFIPLEDGDDTFSAETPVFKLWCRVYAVRLRGAGPMSVIVVLRQTEAKSGAEDPLRYDNGRIIYGEMEGGKIRLQWDSPVVQVRYMRNLVFQDVDGDGNNEIVVGGSYSMGVRGPEWHALSVFNVQGDELTRQNCSLDRNDGVFDAYGDRACPIHGAEVSLDCKSLPCQIDWHEDSDGDPTNTTPYILVGGRYISAGVGNEWHAEGMLSMKEKEYAQAAATFAEAARQIPGSAQFANDAGFAFYKMRKFEDSVTWLKKAIEIDPKRAIAYLNLGDTYAEINRIDEARQAYAKYLELAPDSKLAPEVKRKRDAPHPAEAERPPTAAELHAQGLNLMKQPGYGQQAITKLGEAANLDPSNAEFANDIGYAQFKYGNSEMAEGWLEKATQLDPKRAVAFLNLGDAIVKNLANLEYTVTAPAIRADVRKLKLAKARQAYTKYLELVPDSMAAPDVKKKLAALPPSP